MKMALWSCISFILMYIWIIIILNHAWLILMQSISLMLNMDGELLGHLQGILELTLMIRSLLFRGLRTSKVVMELCCHHTASMGLEGATTIVRTLLPQQVSRQWIKLRKWKNTSTIKQLQSFQTVKSWLKPTTMKLTNGLWNCSLHLTKIFHWSWLEPAFFFLFLW